MKFPRISVSFCTFCRCSNFISLYSSLHSRSLSSTHFLIMSLARQFGRQLHRPLEHGFRHIPANICSLRHQLSTFWYPLNLIQWLLPLPHFLPARAPSLFLLIIRCFRSNRAHGQLCAVHALTKTPTQPCRTKATFCVHYESWICMLIADSRTGRHAVCRNTEFFLCVLFSANQLRAHPLAMATGTWPLIKSATTKYITLSMEEWSQQKIRTQK